MQWSNGGTLRLVCKGTVKLQYSDKPNGVFAYVLATHSRDRLATASFGLVRDVQLFSTGARRDRPGDLRDRYARHWLFPGKSQSALYDDHGRSDALGDAD